MQMLKGFLPNGNASKFLYFRAVCYLPLEEIFSFNIIIMYLVVIVCHVSTAISLIRLIFINNISALKLLWLCNDLWTRNAMPFQTIKSLCVSLRVFCGWISLNFSPLSSCHNTVILRLCTDSTDLNNILSTLDH